jgi:hypothetical protein
MRADRRRRNRQARGQRLAIGLERVGAQIERRAAEQRCLFRPVEARSGHRAGQPGRHRPALRHGFIRADRRRAVSGAIEARGQFRIVLGQAQHGGAAALRHFATGADRGPDQIADGAAILRPHEAPLAEPLRREPVGRSALPARGRDHAIQNVDRGLDPRGRCHRVG